jgi:two-component system chemotaxis response regulator CheB
VSAELDYGIVCVATSAGGLRALGTIFEDLAGDFPVPIVVVQHLHRARRSMMAEILRRKTTLRVEQACGGERIVAKQVESVPAPLLDAYFVNEPAGATPSTSSCAVA